jgi:uncharacterized protein (TIGR03118 family)
MRPPALASIVLLFAAGCSSQGTDVSSQAPTPGQSAIGVASRSAESRRKDPGYSVTPLVSDQPKIAPVTDARLVNAWGLVSTATSPWWIANNGTGTSSLYDGTGAAIAKLPFINVLGDGGAPAAPTGIVSSGGTDFVVTGPAGSGPARFIFASEDGTISGWNPAASPGSIVMVDHAASGAVYKGLAIATTAEGDRLFATDFAHARVDVFDSSFAPVAGELFVDKHHRRGYAPFGIRAIGDVVYVTYAKQDAARHDEVDGRGLGFVDAFSLEGAFLRRVATHGLLNAPWGIAQAPATGFGRASGDLLIGNFGDGHIIAFAPPRDHDHDGDRDDEDDSEGELLLGASGPLRIDGLWGLSFGNGTGSGPVTTLYFAAGPDNENHGLFGTVTAN